MKAWLDFLPVVAFFIAYKLHGVQTAAAVLIVSVSLVYGLVWLRLRRLETGQWITLIASVGLGSLTLVLRNEAWLQWKAPAIYIVMSLVFLGSQWLGARTMTERMLGSAVTLAPAHWRQLNLAWVVFFWVVAGANAWVVLHYPAYWVDFKLFGSLGLTLAFAILQGIWLVRLGALRLDDRQD